MPMGSCAYRFSGGTKVTKKDAFHGTHYKTFDEKSILDVDIFIGQIEHFTDSKVHNGSFIS